MGVGVWFVLVADARKECYSKWTFQAPLNEVSKRY